MNISKIEENVREVLNNFSQDTFIYDLLGAYGKPKASIVRLQKGNLNVSKRDDEILWKKQICFRVSKKNDVHSAFAAISQDKHVCKHNPRFIIASDYETLLAIDTKTTHKIDISIEDLPEYWDFFLPLSDVEKTVIHKDHEADVKAAEKMAEIYDEICKYNPSMSPKQKDAHALNVFLSRLLFCYFAESTEIFKKSLFIETLSSFTEEDGSDLHEFFDVLFEQLNTKNERSKSHKYLRAFPYVNGGLFKEQFKIPKFSKRIRKMIVDSGRLDWSSINPDIFGSMIQSVIDQDQRSCLGMHYTSVPNIMKVMHPLFLNDLYEELNSAKGNKKKLNELYDRLGEIRIFDPACGSGNFLIIAYKELRLFEMQLLKQLEAIGKHPTFLSQVQISQFYGIEIDAFACEIAKLSLWLAEHQMNIVFKKTFGGSAPSLPLKEGGHIICGNATRMDWESVCSQEFTETYILSNPPYKGAALQTFEQKEDVITAFRGYKQYKNLDYICCWLIKGSKYIEKMPKAKLAFVSTTSICQGEQVALLWPHILNMNLEIGFAYQPFKWTNNAKNKAGVTCSIIGIRHISDEQKFIFTNDRTISVENISPYLCPGKNIIINKRSKPLSNLPLMSYGSKPVDDGNFILSSDEKNKIIDQYPKSEKFIKKLVGSDEFIHSTNRWCFWINDNNLSEASKIPEIQKRISKVKQFRIKSNKNATVESSNTPHQFGEIRFNESSCIIIPTISSEKREFIPLGFLNKNTVITNSAHAIYNAELYVFGIISSHMHLAWVRSTAGTLESRIRYSSSICYNNFPIPKINSRQKEIISNRVLNILSEREKHPEKTIAELYDPQKMPAGLREAHRNLDAAVERCYRSKPFDSDEERLEHLFKLYEEMIQNEQKRK